METEQVGKHLTLFEEKQAPMPSAELLALISKWLALFSEHHHKEISPVGAAAYIEGLKDLNCAEVALGCERALKEIDRMPTVAHIRQRIHVYVDTPITTDIFYRDRGCSMCDYTGWRLERRPDGLGDWAKKCDCRRTIKNPD